MGKENTPPRRLSIGKIRKERKGRKLEHTAKIFIKIWNWQLELNFPTGFSTIFLKIFLNIGDPPVPPKTI